MMNLFLTINKKVQTLNPTSLLKLNLDSIPTIILRFTIIAWFISKLLCYRLWLSDRIYPIVPTIEFGFQIPGIVHTIFYIGSLIAILFLYLKPNKWQLYLVLFVIEVASCLLDQTRLQAWEYQYVLMLVIFLTNWKQSDRIISLIVFLLCCTYIYSGICKWNPVFVQTFWQITILQNLLHVPTLIVNNRLVHQFGYALPGIEILGGILIVFDRTKRLGAGLLILMHLFTLLILGPFGINYNNTVWSWNLVMMVYLFLIGFGQQSVPLKSILSRKFLVNLPMLILLFVMPLFGFIEKWPYFFSFSLYSYKAKQLVISFEANSENIHLFEPYFEEKRGYTWANKNSRQVILQNWAMIEINSPPSPEDDYYIKFKEAFFNKFPSEKATFFLYQRGNSAIVLLK